jgi:hypothetical protein
MTKQLMMLDVLDVPKSTVQSRKARLAKLKKRFGIWTHNVGGESTVEFPKWMAMLLPKDGRGNERYSDHRVYCNGSDEPMDIMMGYCRIMEEAGRIQYGHTEEEAVRNLCEENKISFDLMWAYSGASK